MSRDVCTVQGPRANDTSPPALALPAISRKLALLRKSGLFGGDTAGATLTRATTFDDLRAAYCLVHEVYAERGIIHPQPARLRLRIYEATPSMATFVAKVEGRVVAVLSLVSDTKEFGLPSDKVFKPELDALRARGLRLCEVTNQAIAAGYRKSALTTELMRCATAHIFAAGYHRAIATVSPGHAAFYKLLNFVELGSMRSYSQSINDPVVALSVAHECYRECPADADDVRQFINRFMWSENPYLSHVVAWASEARRYFLEVSLLHRLFVAESDFIGRCRESALAHLRVVWGSALYDAVVDRSMHANPVAPWRRGLARLGLLKVVERPPGKHSSRAGARARAPQNRPGKAAVFNDSTSNNPPSTIAPISRMRSLASEA